jgi:hypothetical protein
MSLYHFVSMSLYLFVSMSLYLSVSSLHLSPLSLGLPVCQPIRPSTHPSLSPAPSSCVCCCSCPIMVGRPLLYRRCLCNEKGVIWPSELI